MDVGANRTLQFHFTEEQQLIQNTAQAFFAEVGASARVREAISSPLGHDAAAWRRMAEEFGFVGMGVAEDCGGQGLGLVDLAIVFEQMGRVLFPSPMLATGVLGAALIEEAGSQAQRRRWLGAVAQGKCRVALGVCPQGGACGAAGVSARFVPEGAGFRLDGSYGFVLDAHCADLLLLAAQGPDGQGLSIVLLEASRPGLFPGVTATHHGVLDQTRPMSSLEVAGLPVAATQLLGASGGAQAALDGALQRACIALAAEQAGAAAEALARTLAYSLQRVQFGRAIGGFQAVKHRLADMMVQVEAAKSAVYFAACSADEAPQTLPEMAALAKSQASQALSFCAANMIQLHGGTGFTWEHDAHLYFKRARASATLFGTPERHEDRIATHLGLDAGDQTPPVDAAAPAGVP